MCSHDQTFLVNQVLGKALDGDSWLRIELEMYHPACRMISSSLETGIKTEVEQ